MPPVTYSDKKTEHDMRTRYIDPALYHDSDGPQWDFDLVDHEHPYNDGPIIPDGRGGKRGDTDIPDYVLRANKTLRLAIIEAKNFDKTFTKSNIKDSFKGGDSVMEYTDAEGEKQYKQRTTQQEPKKNTPVRNGFIRGDNKDKVGKPGYSFLNPDLWNVPQQRAPVCHQTQEMDRKENSLDPAGFVFGGASNVMEFHGVGSILPKFNYKEDREEVEEPKRI